MRNTSKLLVVLLAGFMLAGVTEADELERLKGDLAGADERARSVARQLLPRYGTDAVHALVPLLSHADAKVRWAAEKVVEDIANQCGKASRQDDRLEVMAVFTGLINPEASPELTITALRFLPLVVPEGASVDAVSGLLDNPGLREKARACLQHIGTAKACEALVAALPKADLPFACALLDAIGHFESRDSVAPVMQMAATHGDAQVRAAALRATAWTGDPALAKTFQDVRAKATPEASFDTTQALLLLAEAMAKRGGNWEMAMALFKDILSTSEHGILQSAAVMGLGRFGDASAVGAIAKGVKGGNPRLQATAVPALEALQGKEASEAIRDAYPAFDPLIRVRLVEMFGRRGDAAFLSILKAEAKSEDAAFRMATLRALAAASLPDALPILVDAAQNGVEAERAFAMEAATSMAGTLGTTGDAAGAGRAYLNLYTLAKDDALRVTALKGMARYPVVEAYDTVMAALRVESLKAAATEAVPALFAPLAGAGQEDKARHIFELATKSSSSSSTLLNMAMRLQGVNTALDTTQLLGVVKSWHLIGPFGWKTEAHWEKAFVGEPVIDLTKTYPDGSDQRAWKAHTTASATGIVDLMGQVARQEQCFAYAYTEIETDEALPAQVRLGSDDGNMVWVNGTRIWDNRIDRGTAFDQDIVDCELTKGVNRILVKISQGAGGWNFQLRVTRRDGSAAPFRMHAVAE